MTERRSDRVLAIVLSILIHGAILGVLLWGWFQYRKPTATPPSLAIEATVVRNAPPQAQPAPTPTPEEQAAQQAHEEEAARQKAQQQERAAQEKRNAEEQAEQRQREQADR